MPGSRAFANTVAGYTGHQVRWTREGTLVKSRPDNQPSDFGAAAARSTGWSTPGGDQHMPIVETLPNVPPAMPHIAGFPVLGPPQGRPGTAPNVGGSPAPHTPNSIQNLWRTT